MADPDVPVHRPPLPPALGVAVAVVSVSFAAPLFRLADAPPLVASFWRLALATVLLLPFARGAWSSWSTWPRRDWLLAAAAGIALGFHFGTWVTSLFMTTVAASTALVTLQAVFVALGGHFLLGDRLDRRAWLGVVLAFAGAALLAAADGGLLVTGSGGRPALAVQGLAGSRTALLGDLLALAAGVGSAAYMLIGRRLRATRGLVAYVTPVYAVAAVTVLLWGLVAGQGPADVGPSSTFVWFVLLAAVPMLGGHTVANWTIRYLPAHQVATWILLEPVGAALLAWPILGETPSPWVAVGGAVVIAGAALTVRGRVVAEEPAG